MSFVLQVKEDKDAAKLEADLRESRSAIRAGFNEAADAIATHFRESLDAFLAQTIGRNSAEIDHQLAELTKMQQAENTLAKALGDLLRQTHGLIQAIHDESMLPAESV